MFAPSISIAPEAFVNVVDLGSYEIRAGVGGVDGPTYVRPSFIVSDQTLPQGNVGMGGQHPFPTYYSDECYLHRPLPNRVVSSIVANGCITQEENFDALFSYLFRGGPKTTPLLRELNPTYPIAIFQPHYIQPFERDVIASCLLEKHMASALYLGDQEAAAAYSVGKTTALVIDMGYGKTVVSPIVDGQCIRAKSFRSDVIGRMLHEILEGEVLGQLKAQARTQSEPCTDTPVATVQETIVQTGNVSLLTNVQVRQRYDPVTSTYSRSLVPAEVLPQTFVTFQKQLLLAEMCQFCLQASHKPMDMHLDYRGMQKELQEKGAVTSYLLPDGNKVDLSFSASLIPEGLFNTTVYPTFFNVRLLEQSSIQMHAHRAIMSLHDSIQPELASNVIAVGGLSCINGILNRLKLELEAVMPSTLKVKIANAQTNNLSRRFAVWYGGSVLSSLSTFPHFWVSRAEYEEYGTSILDRRRF